MTIPVLPKIKRLRTDPYSSGRRAYERGEPFDPEFGLRLAGWPTVSAQCLYERGRLSAASSEASRDGAKPKEGRDANRPYMATRPDRVASSGGELYATRPPPGVSFV